MVGRQPLDLTYRGFESHPSRIDFLKIFPNVAENLRNCSKFKKKVRESALNVLKRLFNT